MSTPCLKVTPARTVPNDITILPYYNTAPPSQKGGIKSALYISALHQSDASTPFVDSFISTADSIPILSTFCFVNSQDPISYLRRDFNSTDMVAQIGT